MSDSGEPAPAGLVLGGETVRLWGMTAAERARRTLRRAGVTRWARPDESAPLGPVVGLNADWVLDANLVSALVKRPNAALTASTGEVVGAHGPPMAARAALAGGEAAGLVTLSAEALGSGYDAALRRRGPPLTLRLTPANVRDVEARLFASAYKGVTDLVTKYIWPVPARIVTRWCATAGITPNQVTLASLALVLATFALIWCGEFGLGLLAAWAMTFLDTVDGKLARVTLTSSRWGNVFDHGIDLIHPPFWWWAWIVGLNAAGRDLPYEALALAVIVGGYVAQRAIEGAFLALHRLEVHSWRRFDSAFRLITARRNPNLLLLSAGWLLGRPDLGLLAVAVWTAVSLAVHLVQLAQAQWAARHGPLTAWMAA